MSDPVTNAEIEDVLSSIRRLVSEDTRAPAPVHSAETVVLSDRLVLTPALRVAEPEPDEIDMGEDAHPADQADEADATAEQIHDLDAEEAQPWQHDPDATLYDAAHAAQVHGDAEIDLAEEDANDAQAPLDLSAHVISDLPDEVAQTDPDAVEATHYDEAEPARDASHTGADDPQSGDVEFDIDLESQTDFDDEPDGDSDSAPDLADEFDPETDPESDPLIAAGEADLSLGAKVAALETAISQVGEDWEPDGSEAYDEAVASVETLQWEDHAAQDAEAQSAAEFFRKPALDDIAEPGDDRDVLTDDTILDEESLRELVTDIVREELQGALGERITRNVRKLVRREIHRALTAQELE